MAVCCCSMAGTAACQHCANNPFCTDVGTNKTVTVDHIDAKPFGNGLDVCPVCGKPTTIGKPQTKADCIRAMSDEELAEWIASIYPDCPPGREGCINDTDVCQSCWLDWLRQEATDG